MQYLPDTAYQTVGFLYSAGLCFALGILYDLFRMLFYLLTGSDKKFLMLRDIMYLLTCLSATFLFLLVMCNGQILFYAISGEMIGWAIYYFSLSETVFRPARRAMKLMRKVLIPIIFKIRKIFSKIPIFFSKICSFYRKNEKNSKKDLHIRHNIVYNSYRKLYHRKAEIRNRGDENGDRKET